MSSQGTLAKRVLEACRNQLFFANRFLEQALFRLRWEDDGAVYFGSDGNSLCYSADYILERYMQDPQQLMMDYLHTIVHCLYQHPFFVPKEQRSYWDLASDIAVECVIEEIAAGKDTIFFDTAEAHMRHDIIKRVKTKINMMSAHKIFIFLLRNLTTDEEFLDFFSMDFAGLCAVFKRDEHDLWYAQGTVEGARWKNSGPEMNDGNSETGTGTSMRSVQQNKTQLQQMWKGVAEQVLMASQTFARGDMSGNMVKTLQNLTRENYDYSAFLLKFAARLEERMQTDPDEFDYIFYTYGLRLDRRMPLIEPLEYKDKYLLREFVIAIDTSGSCEGELVEKFLVKTYNILRQTESFTSKVNIHIIQCDAAVQENVTIRSQKDLEDYIAHLTLKGFGGTDFRPVFGQIERMIEKGEIQRLEGLLYFTDGYGVFPTKPPKYKTAFVFLEQEENVKVPAWAMKVYLDEEALS